MAGKKQPTPGVCSKCGGPTCRVAVRRCRKCRVAVIPAWWKSLNLDPKKEAGDP
jgi:hypothetical protein